MRILFASSSSGSRGGGELFLLLLGRELAERGHETLLWASTHPRMDELCEAFQKFGEVHRSKYRNMYDHPLRCFSVFCHGGTIRRLAREWLTLKPDVIHLNKQNLEDAFDLQRAVACAGLPAVSTAHITQSASYLGAKMAFFRDELSRRELKKFPGPFVVIQPNRRQEMEAFLEGRGNVVTIENGVYPVTMPNAPGIREAIRRRIGLAPEQTLFVCVARMEEQKQPLLFVEWAAHLHKEFPSAHFLWVGDGRLASAWDEAVAEAQGGQYIQRLGWQKDVKPWLLAADVYLHTARYESFLPLSVLEAMSAGLPIVMPQDLINDIPFLKTQEKFVLPLDDTFPTALSFPREMQRYAFTGRAIYERCFSVKRMVDDYETLYQSVV